MPHPRARRRPASIRTTTRGAAMLALALVAASLAAGTARTDPASAAPDPAPHGARSAGTPAIPPIVDCAALPAALDAAAIPGAPTRIESARLVASTSTDPPYCEV